MPSSLLELEGDRGFAANGHRANQVDARFGCDLEPDLHGLELEATPGFHALKHRVEVRGERLQVRVQLGRFELFQNCGGAAPANRAFSLALARRGPNFDLARHSAPSS